MMQVYVRGSAEAVQSYQKAFGATLMSEYKNDDGNYLHAELNVFGQVLAVSELQEDMAVTGNTMQFCLHFGEADKEWVEKAFRVLEAGARIVCPLGPCPFSPCMVCFIDRFGVNWCLFV
jgi:PhnB protein